MAHEVGHIKDIKEVGRNGLSKYLAVFATGYIRYGGHNKYWREIRADKGQKAYQDFHRFINKTYGKGSLESLFQDKNKSGDEIKKTVDGWWNAFKEATKPKDQAKKTSANTNQ